MASNTGRGCLQVEVKGLDHLKLSQPVNEETNHAGTKLRDFKAKSTCPQHSVLKKYDLPELGREQGSRSPGVQESTKVKSSHLQQKKPLGMRHLRRQF